MSTRLTSSEQIVELVDVVCPTVQNYPNLSYFIDYIHLDTNESRLFVFPDEAKIVFLCEKNGNNLVSNQRSFVNSFYTSSLKSTIESYLPEIFEYFRKQGIKEIQIRTPPDFIQSGLTIPEITRRELRGFTSVVQVSNHAVSNRRLRSIRKAINNGYTFEIAGLEKWQETWTFLESFLHSRNLPSIEYSRIFTLLSRFPSSFSLVRIQNTEGRLIAAALINRIGRAIRVPNYYGDRSFEGSTDLLISKIISLASEENYEFVDLGFSTDPSTGQDVQGIVDFKSEFSASRFEVFNDIIAF